MTQKQHEYMINVWYGANGSETAPMLRTPNRRLWLDRIRELRDKLGIRKNRCRTVEREDITVFSFPANETIYSLWLMMPFTRRPIRAHMGFPEGV